MKKILKDYALLFSVAGLIVALDQFTKFLVRTNIPLGEEWTPWAWLLPYARIRHWTNTGAAFGMLQDMGVVFTILAFVVIAAILYYFPRVSSQDWPLRVAMCLQLGGAAGNLIDRLTQNFQVTDFVSVGSFAVFNVADASISIGVVVLLLGMWWKERQLAKENGPVLEAETGQAPEDSQPEPLTARVPEESQRE